MARYPSSGVTISLSSSSAGAVVDISAQVLEFNGLNLQIANERGDGFGASWEETVSAGMKRAEPITLSGFFDDTAATGIHTLVGNTSSLGAERNFEVNFAGTASDVANCDVIITQYSRIPVRGELVKYSLVLQPTGAVGTAT